MAVRTQLQLLVGLELQDLVLNALAVRSVAQLGQQRADGLDEFLALHNAHTHSISDYEGE